MDSEYIDIDKSGVCNNCIAHDNIPNKRFQKFFNKSKSSRLISRRKLKEIVTTSILNLLNETDYEHEFKHGQKIAVLVRQGKRRPLEKDELESLSNTFRHGYNSVMNPGWWSKVNDWITNIAGSLGYSLIRK
jgi:hypothetical protein